MSTKPEKIVWDTSLRTGHKATDLQHQIFIDILNDLIDSLESGTGEKNFFAILDRIQHYAEWHFHREEKCMIEHQCPVSDVNKVAHMTFMRKVLEFRENSSSGVTIELVHQLYNELSDWFVNHIKKIDCRLNECVNEYDFTDKR